MFQASLIYLRMSIQDDLNISGSSRNAWFLVFNCQCILYIFLYLQVFNIGFVYIVVYDRNILIKKVLSSREKEESEITFLI